MKLLAFFLMSFAASSAFADVKPQMDQMLGYIFELKPYISSEAEYSDPKNAPVIKETLHKMTALSEKIKHDQKISETAKEVSAMNLNIQFKEAAEIFERGNKSYSLWLLRTNLGNCVACHTQLPAKSTSFGSSSKKKYLTNTFREAEFLYIVRNFDKALEFYNRSIAEYPKNKLSPQNLESALTRKVYYFTRVKRDLVGLSDSLQADLKNKKLPPRTADKFRDYSLAALNLSKETPPDLSKEDTVKAYAEKVLKDDLSGKFMYEDANHNLRRLNLSGYLYEFMDKNPKTSLRPSIYYWLSFCESRWEKGPQDSLPESYLRKCIYEFPKSDVAPKCYKEYEELMVFGYTGSSGTHVPAEVTQELEKMRTLIGVKK